MSKMFQILRSNAEVQSCLVTQGSEYMSSGVQPLTASGLQFALLDERTVLQAETDQFTAGEASIEIISIEARMKSYCAGLIEPSTTDDVVQVARLRSGVTKEVLSGFRSPLLDGTTNWGDPKVQFIHRSVTEYLWREDVWNTIRAQTDHLGFHPLVAALRSVVMQAKKCPFGYQFKESQDGNIDPWYLVSFALELAYQLEETQGTAQMELLDALETTLNTRCGADWWDTYRDEFYREPPWYDNFFAFTVRYGLWRYVQARLQTRCRETMQKPGRPLLDYACRPVPTNRHVWLRGTDCESSRLFCKMVPIQI